MEKGRDEGWGGGGDLQRLVDFMSLWTLLIVSVEGRVVQRCVGKPILLHLYTHAH